MTEKELKEHVFTLDDCPTCGWPQMLDVCMERYGSAVFLCPDHKPFSHERRSMAR